MAKLTGKAKAAFLAKMAAGRKRSGGRRKNAKRVTKRDVDYAAADFSNLMTRYGPNNMATQRAEHRYRDAQKAWAEQKAKRTKKPNPRKAPARRRRNPDLLTISGNPSRTSLEAARRAYRQFHGIEPDKMTQLGGKGPALVALGELREVVYQPRKGARKGPAFFHQFKPGNVLAVTADGKRLVIVDRRKRRSVDFDLGIVN